MCFATRLEESAPVGAGSAKPFVFEVFENVCIAQNVGYFKTTTKFRCFRLPREVQYRPFCDDFGPMNLSSTTKFIEILHQEISEYAPRKIIFCVESGKRQLTNAVYLLGAYMILKLKLDSDEVSRRFSRLGSSVLEAFRDATHSHASFLLTLDDCWRGLERSRNLGWFDVPKTDGTWGHYDMDRYNHFDNPLNADMHEVVPGKFFAFRGPVDLGGRNYSDEDGFRRFSPLHFVQIFRQTGVTDVIRLNHADYNARDFTDSGITHHPLTFTDCSAPPPALVATFLAAAESARGAVAVHCRAGLGRTGTLIALYLMKHHGFAPREAMGWLRIVRPGCVIGEQQHYLCSQAALAAIGQGPAVPVSESAVEAGTCRLLAQQVADAIDRRSADALWRASSAQG